MNNKKTYLLYIRQYSIIANDYVLHVYKVTTDNVYRVIGKICYTASSHIKRIDYNEYLEERENFWKEKNYTVRNYVEPILNEDQTNSAAITLKTYLLYVQKYNIFANDYVLHVFKVTTDNIYRVIGKIRCTSMEHIKRISFCKYTETGVNICKEMNQPIDNYFEPILSAEKAR